MGSNSPIWERLWDHQPIPERGQVSQLLLYIVNHWSIEVKLWCLRKEGNKHEKSENWRIPLQTLLSQASFVGSEYTEVMVQPDCGVSMGGRGGREQLLFDKHIIYQKYPKVAYNITLLFTVRAHYTSTQWHVSFPGGVSSVPYSCLYLDF